MRSFLIISILFFQYLAFTQTPTVGLTQFANGASDEYTFFCPQTGDCYLIDECGILVNSWHRDYLPGLSANLLANGLMLRTARVFDGYFGQASTGGKIELVDWENNTVGSYKISNEKIVQHHDALMMPNGNLLVLVWENLTSEEIDSLGVQTINRLWSEAVYELALIDETEYEIVWEWNLKNHLIQNVDSLLSNYAVIEDNIGKVNVNYRGPASFNSAGRWHCNAIDYHPELDQIMINSRDNSEVWIIDHSTTTSEAASNFGGNSGKGGQLIYRWGNPEAYDRGDESDLKMYGSHGTYWIPEGLPNAGKILYFNNGDARPEGYYSTVEMINPILLDSFSYELNEQQLFLPILPELVYQAEEPTDFFSMFLSNAQQLSNGNVFINEGGNSRFFEVNPQTNSIVWEYISPVVFDQFIPQGEIANNSSSFRAHKYEEDFGGFLGQELIGSQPLEQNPWPYICNSGIFIDIKSKNPSCFDSEFGSITITLVGADQNYNVKLYQDIDFILFDQILIPNEETIFNNLTPGSYSLIITDENKQEYLRSIQILTPEPISLDIEIGAPQYDYCDDELEPNVFVTINGGNPPYNFKLLETNGNLILEDSFDTSSLGISPKVSASIQYSGDFIIEINDQNDCFFEQTFSINDDDFIKFFQIEFERISPSDINESDGKVIAHVNGGVRPYTYTWLSPDGEIQQDSIYENGPIGDYVIQYKDSNGCSKTETITLDFVSSTKIEENNLSLNFYPNPASDFIHISTFDSDNFQNIHLNILNTSGHILLSTNLSKSKEEVDIKFLPPGLYFAKIQVEDKIIYESFLKY